MFDLVFYSMREWGFDWVGDRMTGVLVGLSGGGRSGMRWESIRTHPVFSLRSTCDGDLSPGQRSGKNS